MTQSLEDYLETIFLIIRENKVARVKTVSEKLNVKKPSVINAVKELIARGMATHEKYGYIELTKEGISAAEKIYEKHTLILHFLKDILGLPSDISEKDACRIEHVLSPQTFKRFKDYVNNINVSK